MKSNLVNKSTGYQTIEQDINSILQALTTNIADGERVERGKIERGSSRKGAIQVKRGERLSTLYVLYPSIYFPDLLGSVAIYSDDVKTLYGKLKSQSSFFGHPIKSVSLEYGLSTYVDVRIRP